MSVAERQVIAVDQSIYDHLADHFIRVVAALDAPNAIFQNGCGGCVPMHEVKRLLDQPISTTPCVAEQWNHRASQCHALRRGVVLFQARVSGGVDASLGKNRLDCRRKGAFRVTVTATSSPRVTTINSV